MKHNNKTRTNDPGSELTAPVDENKNTKPKKTGACCISQLQLTRPSSQQRILASQKRKLPAEKTSLRQTTKTNNNLVDLADPVSRSKKKMLQEKKTKKQTQRPNALSKLAARPQLQFHPDAPALLTLHPQPKLKHTSSLPSAFRSPHDAAPPD